MSATTFITDDFLLQSKVARTLYHDYAKNLPIIDYHCHVPPKQIAEDQQFDNLTQIWLYGDHYKWRTMRACGVEERFVTGDATDWEKFEKWAETVPRTLRNPLYHWSHLELKRFFDVNSLLSADTAEDIWETCNSRIRRPEFSCRGLMKMSNVALVCTTDDPCDDLAHHKAIAQDESFEIQVLPAWRPDNGMNVESPQAFNVWVDTLSAASNIDIRSFSTYLDALRNRHDFFHAMGCRLSDHGIETAYADDYTASEIEAIFDKVRGGEGTTVLEARKFKSAMLYEFGVMDAEKGWTQQYHFGALRSVNSRMLKTLGPNTGYDTIGDFDVARPLAKMLNRLDREDRLAKTILYNLNPKDNELFAAMIGNFQGGGVPGKMQFGSGWWFMDQMDGMRKQMEALSNMGLLSLFVGMLTDSRSFLSYPRHEYFRRILCNMLGNDIERGLMPNDMDLVGGMVRDICYNNAATYFGFKL